MNKNKTNINWFPGHMAKTKKQIRELLPMVDVVFEIVDARIPYSSKIVDIDDLIKNKPRVLIMSKADLCDKSETNKWVKKYEDDGYKVILANLSNKNDVNSILSSIRDYASLINEKRLNKGLNEKELRALVVGVPNVGKSTFINTVVGKSVASVGNKPGVTTNLNWLKTNVGLLLLDTPGILWPRIEEKEVGLNLASMSAISDAVIPKDEVCIYILNMLDKYYNNILNNRYNVSHVNNDDICETYDAIGKRMGALIRGGEVDYDRVTNIVINDIKAENIKGITFDRL